VIWKTLPAIHRYLFTPSDLSLMITKEELLEGQELLYTGKAFTGFREENPFVTFLGYDSNGWSNIWVKYGGRTIFTSLRDVMLKQDLSVTSKVS
jgi:hypothetical protein